jgi:hypothetical protein
MLPLPAPPPTKADRWTNASSVRTSRPAVRLPMYQPENKGTLEEASSKLKM